MRHYEASAVIGADAATIWAILTDAPAYASWRSGVIGVDGVVALGQRITVRSEASPRRAFPVRVTTLDAPRRMVWSGGMPLGLFRGVRTYSLEPQGPAQTLFTMREEYSGPLLGLIWRSMPDLQPSFDTFAKGLKERAERGTA